MYHRTRSRGDEVSLNPFSSVFYSRFESRKQFADGHWIREDRNAAWAPVGTSTLFSDEEQISDTVGNVGGYNGCSHTHKYPIRIGYFPKTEMATISTDDLSTSWNRTGTSWSGSSTHYSVEGHLGSAAWSPSFDRSIDWNSLVQAAGDAVSGSMVSRMNILVTLAEMQQTMRMFKNPFGLLTARWRRSNKPLRQLSKAGANVWLEYKYGWKQFYRDFREITKVLDKTAQHMEYLRRTRESWTSVTRSQTDEVSCPIQTPSIGSITDGVRATVTNLVAKRRANVSLQLLRGAEFQLLSRQCYLTQALGGDKLIEALWDLVPFSFVVDWFIDISRFAALNPILWNQHRIKRLGYSVSTDWYADISLDTKCTYYANCSPAEYLLDDVYANQRVRKSYSRYQGFPPDSETAGWFGNFSFINIADSGALIAQRI